MKPFEDIKNNLFWNEAMNPNGNIPQRSSRTSRVRPARSRLSVSLHKMCQILQSGLYWPNRHCRIYFTHINRQDSRISNEEAIWIMYITLPFSSTIKHCQTIGIENWPGTKILSNLSAWFLATAAVKFYLAASAQRRPIYIYINKSLPEIFLFFPSKSNANKCCIIEKSSFSESKASSRRCLGNTANARLENGKNCFIDFPL